jgi:hypothetical protein
MKYSRHIQKHYFAPELVCVMRPVEQNNKPTSLENDLVCSESVLIKQHVPIRFSQPDRTKKAEIARPYKFILKMSFAVPIRVSAFYYPMSVIVIEGIVC